MKLPLVTAVSPAHGSVCSLEQAGRDCPLGTWGKIKWFQAKEMAWAGPGNKGGPQKNRTWKSRAVESWTWTGLRIAGMGLGRKESIWKQKKNRSGEMRPDLRRLMIQHSGVRLSQAVATVCNRQEMFYNRLRNLRLEPLFPRAFCPDLLRTLLSTHPHLCSQTSSVQTSQDSLSCRNSQLTSTYEKAPFLLPSPLHNDHNNTYIHIIHTIMIVII